MVVFCIVVYEWDGEVVFEEVFYFNGFVFWVVVIVGSWEGFVKVEVNDVEVYVFWFYFFEDGVKVGIVVVE